MREKKNLKQLPTLLLSDVIHFVDILYIIYSLCLYIQQMFIKKKKNLPIILKKKNLTRFYKNVQKANVQVRLWFSNILLI